MEKVLITGGAGFIGSHLAEKLLGEGKEVFILDNFSTGSRVNLEPIKDHPRLHVKPGDISDKPLLVELAGKADMIFHMAAAVGVKLIVEKPVNTIETNIIGTENVLKAASETGNKKLVLASTSEVYGKGTEKKFHEEDDLIFGSTTHSRWSYGCSKAIDEFLALAYHRSQGLPVIIVRLFNTVGPRQVGDYGMVVPRFVQQAINGDPICVYGDGKQVRCFTHVNDVVNALCLLADNEECVGQIFNVGNDDPVTIKKLAEKVRKIVNPNATIKHISYQKAYGAGFEDIRVRRPDISKLLKAIEYTPKAGLNDIIQDVKDHLLSDLTP